MFEGTPEMNEHLGHAGSGVGSGEWHFGHLVCLVTETVDNILRWAIDRAAAYLNDVSGWRHLSDMFDRHPDPWPLPVIISMST